MTSNASLADATPPISDAGSPPTPEAWAAAFAVALPDTSFLDRHATPEQRDRGNSFHSRVELTPVQRALLEQLTQARQAHVEAVNQIVALKDVRAAQVAGEANRAHLAAGVVDMINRQAGAVAGGFEDDEELG